MTGISLASSPSVHRRHGPPGIRKVGSGPHSGATVDVRSHTSTGLQGLRSQQLLVREQDFHQTTTTRRLSSDAQSSFSTDPSTGFPKVGDPERRTS